MEVRRLRSTAAQLLACTSPNLLLLDLGMAISFATIALPDLLNAPQGLSLNETQASWFGSTVFLTQPIGALLSGPIVDYFGRRKANCLVNIPHLIAWVLMYFAWDIPSLFLANSLLGLGTGIMEAPINSYVAEISEPCLRGSLCTLTTAFGGVGMFITNFLGTVVDWRLAALICLSVPVASMILVLLVPDTPIWLLSRGRENDALRSLCYLRGWTSPANVKEEFDQLALYSQQLKRCVVCPKTDNEPSKEKHNSCEHSQISVLKRQFPFKCILKLRYVMLVKETLGPLTMSMLYFAFYEMSGLASIRPNMVNVCSALGMTGDGEHITVMVGVIALILNIMLIGLVKVFGKRKLALISMLGTALSTAGLSIYSWTSLDNSVFSYNPETFPKETSYVPLVLLYSLTTFTGLAVPWVILGEIFPFRSRASAQSIAAAENYVIMFIGAKTFIDLELNFRLWGTFAFYAILGVIGTIYLYFFLPETEGKTLQEIEAYYNGEVRTFADDFFINLFRKT